MRASSIVLSACIVVAAFTVSWGIRIRHLTEGSSVGPSHTEQWMVNPTQVAEDFQPLGTPLDKSDFGPFAKSKGKASVGKAMTLLASVRSGTVADPFPQLTSFYVLSGSDGQWYEFKREAAPPEPSVDSRTEQWMVNPTRVAEDFQPLGTPLDKSGFGPFEKSEGKASVGKAKQLLASVRSGDVADPFPQLTKFYVLSGSEGKWYEFKREAAPLKPDVDRQLIITVQRGQDSLYCLKNIRSRVNCAINYEKNSKRAETAASWTILRVPEANASEWERFPDLSERFGGDFTLARESILENNGEDLGTENFKMVSWLSPEVVNVFQKQRISKEDRIKYVETYKKERKSQTRYPDHVCPGSDSNVDIKKFKVLPFPGASSWMLQLKWEKAGKPTEKSPILDMRGDWHEEMTNINEDPGRVRIYFVGHSSGTRDWFGSRTGGNYDSKKVSSMLVDAGLSQERPITISFVACKAAKVFCPNLARKLSSLGFKQVTLHCRLRNVGRWTGGAFLKKAVVKGKARHKAANTKLIFRTDAEDPGIGTVAY